MSYDLRFNRDEPLTGAEFFGYFEGKRWYQFKNQEVWYQNNDTGVYFSFSWRGDSKDENRGFLASFNLNFVRPRFFGLEAAVILKALTAHFGFAVKDNREQKWGAFSTQGFLLNWNHGNEISSKGLLSLSGSSNQALSRPSPQLENIWRWNFRRPRITKELERTVFVPTINWVKVDGELKSMVIWPDGIACLVPAVEKVIIPRSTVPGERSVSRVEPVQIKDICMVDQEALDQCLGPLQQGNYPLPCRRPDYVQPGEKIINFVEGLMPEVKTIVNIRPDKVLDDDLVPARGAP